MYDEMLTSVHQIAQDDEGFDLASIRSSMDLESNPDLTKPTPPSSDSNAAPPPYGAGGSNNRDASPLPAPIPQKPAPIPRESLDGETIFAVGEGGDSDDESDDGRGSGERARLTGAKPE